LRREHEEWHRQRAGLSAHGHRSLLHRLEERALRLRRGAVYLVGEHEVCEQRSWLVPELAVAVLLRDHVGADDVGRELDACEAEVQGLPEGADEHRLAETGHALQQHVTTADQAYHRLADELFLADDQPRELRLESLGELGDPAWVEPRLVRDHWPLLGSSRLEKYCRIRSCSLPGIRLCCVASSAACW